MNKIDSLLLNFLRERRNMNISLVDVIEFFGAMEDREFRKKVLHSIDRLWKAGLLEVTIIGDNYGEEVFVKYPFAFII